MTGSSLPATDAWTAFWQTGSRASCFQGSGAELRLHRVWDEFVDGFEDGARLLDLATGNGTVACRCAARARARNIHLRIEGVDAAAIDPPASVDDPDRLLRDIRFHGGVRLESLPFPDAAFDGVVSQFGFEYAEEKGAVRESVRVLAPSGRLRLVVHARDGAVSEDIRRRLERLQGVLAETGPVSLVLALARAAETGDRATLRRAPAGLPDAAEHVRQLALNPPPDDAALFYSREFMALWARRDRYRPADLRRSLEDGWNNASGVAARQQQMLNAARSSEDIARIGSHFAAAGLRVNGTREIRDSNRGARIAWLLDAGKPTGAPS
jgi:SAM-dependent methyltransferase